VSLRRAVSLCGRAGPTAPQDEVEERDAGEAARLVLRRRGTLTHSLGHKRCFTGSAVASHCLPGQRLSSTVFAGAPRASNQIASPIRFPPNLSLVRMVLEQLWR